MLHDGFHLCKMLCNMSIRRPWQFGSTLEVEVAMSFGDSAAVFKARAADIGLTDDEFKKLESQGLTTMASFAFCCHFNPSASDEKPLVDLVTKVLATSPTLKQMSCFRRLFAEAYATIASDIKARVEASEDSSVKRLAPADRAERLKEQQSRLKGIDLSGHREPGDGLVDRAVSMYESDRLQYIEWVSCVSRQHELLTGQKKDSSVSFDNTGALKINTKTVSQPCDVSTDMMVRYALVRRGLALEQANILAYSNHDSLVEKYMAARLLDPPPGYARIGLKQIETDDRQFFVLMAEKTRGGIMVKGGARPCDDHFASVLSSSEFLQYLRHRPLAAGASSEEPPAKVQRTGKGEKGKGGKGRGKASSQRAPSSTNMRVPAELLAMGCVACAPKGHRLCFDYSLGKCQLPTQNQRCAKGLHLCAIKSCHKVHPAFECPQRKKE